MSFELAGAKQNNWPTQNSSQTLLGADIGRANEHFWKVIDFSLINRLDEYALIDSVSNTSNSKNCASYSPVLPLCWNTVFDGYLLFIFSLVFTKRSTFFCMLLYHTLTHIVQMRLSHEHRNYPRFQSFFRCFFPFVFS